MAKYASRVEGGFFFTLRRSTCILSRRGGTIVNSDETVKVSFKKNNDSRRARLQCPWITSKLHNKIPITTIFSLEYFAYIFYLITMIQFRFNKFRFSRFFYVAIVLLCDWCWVILLRSLRSTVLLPALHRCIYIVRTLAALWYFASSEWLHGRASTIFSPVKAAIINHNKRTKNKLPQIIWNHFIFNKNFKLHRVYMCVVNHMFISIVCM